MSFFVKKLIFANKNRVRTRESAVFPDKIIFDSSGYFEYLCAKSYSVLVNV